MVMFILRKIQGALLSKNTILILGKFKLKLN